MNHLKNDVQSLAITLRGIFYIPTWKQFVCTFTQSWLARHPGTACFYVCGFIDGLFSHLWMSLNKETPYSARLLELYVKMFNFSTSINIKTK